jgi:hypothetical protein
MPQLRKKDEAPLKSAFNGLGILLAKLSGSAKAPLSLAKLPSESDSPSDPPAHLPALLRVPITAHARYAQVSAAHRHGRHWQQK